MELYKDDSGHVLHAETEDDGLVLVKTGPEGVMVAGADLAGVFRDLCEAAGEPVPVMIGRPDLGGARSRTIKGLTVERTPGGAVQFTIGGKSEAFSSVGARAVAAVTVTLADLSCAEPDDDDEFALAAVMARHPGATFPELARAVLAEYRVEKLDGGR